MALDHPIIKNNVDSRCQIDAVPSGNDDKSMTMPKVHRSETTIFGSKYIQGILGMHKLSNNSDPSRNSMATGVTSR